MILARTTGTVVGLMVGMLLMMGGCGTESSPTAGMGQVILEQTRAVFASSVLPGQEATLDIVGVRTNIPMTVNPDGSVTATVDGVPAGTWTFRVTYRAGSGSARYVIAEASAVGTVVANATTVVRLTTLTNLGAPATAITAKSSHVCASLADGLVSCWGDNNFGQLGNGTMEPSSSPVPVIGLSAPATGVAAGANHSCALLTGGTVACWGANFDGQLGNGTTTPSASPVTVTGLSAPVTAIAAGFAHTCAVLTGGTVSCWGVNGSGQLGNGTTMRSSSPVTVTGLATAVDITAGSFNSCARLDDGTVACWGANSDGQLGNGTTTSSSSPVPVAGLAPALEVAAGGSHSCARLSPTTVSCWGANGFGQLGNGTTTSSSSPVPVTGLSAQVFAIAAGLNHSCARLGPTTVSCWGANDSGQLGNGTSTASSSPVTVFNLVGVTGVSTLDSGDAHNCARLNSGTVRCWGSNLSGQLGDETRDTSFIPVMVTGLTTATAVAAGNSHSCARLASGTVSCWGANGSGQLGNGVLLVSPLPVQVVGIP